MFVIPHAFDKVIFLLVVFSAIVRTPTAFLSTPESRKWAKGDLTKRGP